MFLDDLGYRSFKVPSVLTCKNGRSAQFPKLRNYMKLRSDIPQWQVRSPALRADEKATIKRAIFAAKSITRRSLCLTTPRECIRS